MPLIRLSLIALTAVGLAMTGPGFAQDTEATEAPAAEAPAPSADAPAVAAPAAETPAADAPAADAAPAPASPEGAAPMAGEPAAAEVLEVVKATHGDWEVRCAPEGDNCFMYQLALDGAKNPVAEVSLLKLPAGSEAAAGVTVVTPLGTLLTSGVVLQIDTGEKRQYPFAWCSQVGCFARFGLDTGSLASLKRGKAGKIMLLSVGAPDKPVELALSLTGFTAAFDELTVPAAPAN